MADRADFFIKNHLTDDINAARKLPDGTSDWAVVITTGNEEQVHLAGPEVLLRIDAPEGLDTKDCPFNVKSDVDLAVSHSRSGSNWTLQVVSSELPPDTPLSANVSVGEPGPG